ncbi:MAG: AAA family ATPase, partial [Leptospiraceae bacterium]|nr:AAA family ATPase [Leptospiraceae bacterium]
MIPEKLTIKGIYSYRKEQSIDFTKLTSERLFGIFGKVGSGKSSILEAITFVLYNKSERLSKNDKINYNMLNLKSKEYLIELIFSHNNQKYKFVASGKRSKKEFEKIDTKRSAYEELEGKWIPIEKSADEVLGVNYNNFNRTIIIHQGKFQEFLMLPPKDRSSMLKELFFLEKFDLSEKVKQLFFKTQEGLNIKEGALGELGSSEEDIEAIEQKISEKNKESKNVSKTLNDKKEKLNQLEENYKIIQRVDIQRKKIQELELKKSH